MLAATTHERAVLGQNIFSELKKLANMQSIQMKNIFALVEWICTNLSRDVKNTKPNRNLSFSIYLRPGWSLLKFISKLFLDLISIYWWKCIYIWNSKHELKSNENSKTIDKLGAGWSKALQIPESGHKIWSENSIKSLVWFHSATQMWLQSLRITICNLWNSSRYMAFCGNKIRIHSFTIS